MIRLRVRRLFRLGLHRDVDARRDVEDEMRSHIEMRVEQLVSEGWEQRAARAEAERRFASSDHARRALEASAVRRESRLRLSEQFDSLVYDVRYAVRTLRRSPGFTMTVIVTFALGLGANAALFALLDRMFLQNPAGVREPDEVRRVQRPSGGAPAMVYSFPGLRDIAEALPPGTAYAGYRTELRIPFDSDGEDARGVVTYVVGDYFGTLGVAMARGRPFAPDEWQAGSFAPVAVVSSRFATLRYASPDAALGKSIDIARRRYTIIGVAAAGFAGTDLDASDAWAPLNTRGSWTLRETEWLEDRRTLFLQMLARVTDSAVVHLLPAITAAMRTDPIVRDTLATAAFRSLRQALPSFMANERQVATRLAGVAVLILLIACANVANIMLARTLTHRREIAVRLALGVSRRRLMRQLVTQSVTLALAACAGAVVVAIWCASALRTALLPNVQWGAPAVGWRVVLFAVVSALAAGFAVGLLPALQASRPQLTRTLRGGARDGAAHSSRLRGALVVAQVTLSLVLLAGAGLFIRSLREVQSVNLGYDADRIVLAGIRAPRDANVSSTAVSDRLIGTVERLEQQPGVESVAFSENIPMWSLSFLKHYLPDRDSLPTPPNVATIVSFVSPRFFATMGMQLLDGRDFNATDRRGSEPVIVVNKAMADLFWPRARALEKCLIVGERNAPCRRVVGVVSNAHYLSVVEGPSIQFYIPVRQEGDDGRVGRAGALEVRAGIGRTAVVAEAVRRELARAAPAGTSVWVRSLSEQLEPEFRTWRLGAQLFSLAGLLALVVALVGISGNVSYTLSQRTHEMGVRIALGAKARDIIRMVLGEGMRTILIGVVCGLGVALAAGRLIRSMLYGTPAHDPTVLAAVAAVLILAAALASLGPAIRATRVDPIDSLRSE